MNRWIKALCTPPLMALAALLMFVEEVLWESAKRLMALLGRLPLIRSIEAWIAALPPYGAAAVFLLPGILLLPVKISALWLMAHGHALLGVQVIIGAKLAGTALVARIFTLTKPQLMTLHWFAVVHDFINKWRTRLYGWVKSSQAWQRLQEWRHAVHAWWGRFRRHWKPGRIGRRFRAIQRRHRRAAFHH